MESSTDIATTCASAGRKGGQSTSAAKQAASRANGKLGGRPRIKKAPKISRRGVVILTMPPKEQK
jgi:hypothetical protein